MVEEANTEIFASGVIPLVFFGAGSQNRTADALLFQKDGLYHHPAARGSGASTPVFTKAYSLYGIVSTPSP